MQDDKEEEQDDKKQQEQEQQQEEEKDLLDFKHLKIDQFNNIDDYYLYVILNILELVTLSNELIAIDIAEIFIYIYNLYNNKYQLVDIM